MAHNIKDNSKEATLLKIEQHLKALVNLKIIKMTENRANLGDFTMDDDKKEVFSLDKLKEYQNSLLNQAYKGL